jgi:hypothetical protein
MASIAPPAVTTFSMALLLMPVRHNWLFRLFLKEKARRGKREPHNFRAR